MPPLAQTSSDLDWVAPQTTTRGLEDLSTSITSHSSPPRTPQHQQQPSPPPPPSSKITPTLLYVIVILAVVFFVSGLLHLLIRFLLRQRSRESSSENSDRGDVSDSEAIQRQLQQLFHLHDSGLDQAFIDALPIFLYKELVGAKEPFDCAVCLCEFADDDKLRLLPVCSHAFHLDCIDTWLLSNSTCPLCRGTLFIPGMAMENPIYDLDDTGDEGGMRGDLEEGGEDEKMVFPVRLGKFRSTRGGDKGEGEELHGTNRGAKASNLRREEGESSGSSSLDRRCYSMGSYQYVVWESLLQVALSTGGRRRGNGGRGGCGAVDGGGDGGGRGGGGGVHEGMMEGRRLCVGGRGESFSVSKIWQWSGKNGRCPIPSDVASLDGGLGFPWRGGNREGSSSMCGIIYDP